MKTGPDAVMRAELSVGDVVRQLRALGVSLGDVLLVHTSFREVRPVSGGPEGLIEALTEAVGEGGTIVMPSWPDDVSGPFDPATTDAARDLGVVARTFWRLPGVKRTEHVQAFAARGRDAGAVLRDPLPLPPHIVESPVGRVHELDGKVLLLGVDHDSNTTIHLAEVLAGVPYGIRRSCLTRTNGKLMRIGYRENDHCCSRFRLVNEWLRAAEAQADGPVGHARARMARSRAVTSQVVARLRAQPSLFLHDRGSGCEECDKAHASIAGRGDHRSALRKSSSREV